MSIPTVNTYLCQEEPEIEISLGDIISTTHIKVWLPDHVPEEVSEYKITAHLIPVDTERDFDGYLVTEGFPNITHAQSVGAPRPFHSWSFYSICPHKAGTYVLYGTASRTRDNRPIFRTQVIRRVVVVAPVDDDNFSMYSTPFGRMKRALLVSLF